MIKRVSNLSPEEKADWLMARSNEELVRVFEECSSKLRAGLDITWMSLEERQEDYNLAKHELLTRLSLK